MAAYVHGNVVRKEHVSTQNPANRMQETQRRAHAKRKKTIHMNRGYVIFLAVAAVMALFACVQYLQLQSDITKRSHEITSLQQELADAKEENATRYNVIMNSLNLEEIREKAIHELGMVPAEANQIIKYQSPNGSTIVQYAGIPKSGIVASSDIVE